MTQELLLNPSAPPSVLSAWAGIYTTRTDGTWGEAFSPILVNEDDLTVDFGGNLVDVTYDSSRSAMTFSATVTENNQNYAVTATITFVAGNTPTLTGSLVIDGAHQTMTGTQINALPAPTIGTATPANGLLDIGDEVVFQTRGGSYLTVNSSNQIVATAQQLSGATTFTVKVLGSQIMLTAGSRVVTVGSDHRLMLGNQPSTFTTMISTVGYALLGDGSGNYWNLNTDDNTIALIPDDGLIHEMEFGLRVTPVPHAQLCARYGIQPDLPLGSCDAELAAFIWQITVDLFLALGLNSYIGNADVKSSAMQLIMKNSTTNGAVTQAWKAIGQSQDPIEAASYSFKVLSAILTSDDQNGNSMLWALVKLVFSELGWLALAWAVAKIVTVVALPQAQGAQTVGAFLVWIAQTIQAAVAVVQCPGGPSVSRAIAKA
jgi:hypothetical protein